jgi:hypothetical protein
VRRIPPSFSPRGDESPFPPLCVLHSPIRSSRDGSRGGEALKHSWVIMNSERPRRRWKTAALLLALTVAAVACGTAADVFDGAADGARHLQDTGA